MKLLSKLMIISMLFLNGCDTEKFLGYNYNAERIQKSVQISGQVTNVFNDQVVPQAIVDVNGQSAVADNSGHYSFTYFLTGDDEFSRPATVSVSSPKYYTHRDSVLIFAEGNLTWNFELVYGAPIIEAMALPQQTWAQAVLFDYQGLDNIASVIGHFSTVDADGITTSRFNRVLTLKAIISDKAHYQAQVPSVSPDGSLSRTFSITVIDHDGFEDSMEHFNHPLDPDAFLFNPN